jgi:hypothetical protein
MSGLVRRGAVAFFGLALGVSIFIDAGSADAATAHRVTMQHSASIAAKSGSTAESVSTVKAPVSRVQARPLDDWWW